MCEFSVFSPLIAAEPISRGRIVVAGEGVKAAIAAVEHPAHEIGHGIACPKCPFHDLAILPPPRARHVGFLFSHCWIIPWNLDQDNLIRRIVYRRRRLHINRIVEARRIEDDRSGDNRAEEGAAVEAHFRLDGVRHMVRVESPDFDPHFPLGRTLLDARYYGEIDQVTWQKIADNLKTHKPIPGRITDDAPQTGG